MSKDDDVKLDAPTEQDLFDQLNELYARAAKYKTELISQDTSILGVAARSALDAQLGLLKTVFGDDL
jgi:hypothetical protein